ncbi:MAG: prepilin-type N-terminal cleavage/methylation domain-containing protein [Elusimicrobiota bacterium]|jgi:prepilin-type N-terminal cleavage/methylation domain-containing protein
MRKSRGFSLIELVISVSLASFVLVGVATIAAQMARNQVDGIRSGTVTGWSVVSYAAMAKEIEDANVLVYPVNNGDSADQIVICKNWSRNASPGPPGGGRLNTDATGDADGVAKGTVYVIQYCVDPTAPVAPLTGFTLRRYANVGLPPGVTCPASAAMPVACNLAGPGWTKNDIVGFRLEKLGGMNMFQRDNTIGGVRLRYVIGRQTASTAQPIPKFTTFNFGIAMQKQYTNTLD